MSNLAQTKQFSLIVMKDDKALSRSYEYEDIIKALPLRCKYYVIRHDQDFNEDGTLKVQHFHIVLRLPEKRTKGAVAKEFTRKLGCSPDVVTSSPIAFAELVSNIRYLCHVDDPNKYLYSINAVRTNDMSNFITCMDGAVTYERIYNVVQKCNSLTDIIRELGIDAYRINRFVVNDMWRDKMYRS